MSGNGRGARTFVIGVGMTKFEKPGAREWDYPDMAKEAGHEGAGGRRHPLRRGRAGFVGYCYGESTSGQRAVYQLGLTGIPVVNVNNNCSTGSTRAVHGAPGGRAAGWPTARWRSASRRWRRARWGSSTPTAPTRSTSTRRRCSTIREPEASPPAPQMFGNAGREHMERYGSEARPLRLDRLEEPQALGQQPLRPVPGRVHARGHQGGEDDPRRR